MHLVAVQLDTVWHDKPANHAKVKSLLDSATIPPDSLIVLPEMFDTGFSMDVTATVQGPERESEAFLRDIANTYESAVIGGVVSPEPDAAASNGGRNEAVCFAPDGTELVRYRKTQPFALAGEAEHYGYGDGHRLFEWQGVTIAPFVCYDLRFPEVFRPAAKAGAELIVVMAVWPEVRSEHWVRLLQARAIENQAVTIGVNRCGADPTLTYDGRTCGFDHMGKRLFEADRKEQVCHVDVEVSKVREWREKFPALGDIRSL